jgi:hypothetical protein
LARADSCRRARKEYRDSDEGKAAHRDEEERRRGKRAQRNLGVGDHRCEGIAQRLQVPLTAAACSRTMETSDVSKAHVQWVVVAWPGLFEQARALLGTQVVCPRCGRAGCVVQVVELAKWQRTHVGCK